MDKIYETNSNFNFDKLLLSKPILQNGGYFIKYSIHEFPLYIRPPKSMIKQIVKNTKKINCDLIFSQENDEFIQWMENLENHSQQTIFKNKNLWFESNLELEDIENSFTSPMKTYKSGKFYIVRTNITQRLGKINIKIFNEDETDILLEDVSANMNVMTILEVQGIKCSSKSFQIEIELKQMMVLHPIDLFDKCILNYKKNEIHIQKTDTTNNLGKIILEDSKTENNEYHAIKNLDVSTIQPLTMNPPDSTIEKKDMKEWENESNKETLLETNENNKNLEKDLEKDEPNIHILDKLTDNKTNELYEIDFNLEEIPETETITLKQRDDVYYEMYREARRKAKIAKDLALSAFLEARQIKNKYMLEDISDSDEDDFYFNEENK